MKLVELPDTLAEKVGCLIQPVIQRNDVADDPNAARDVDLESRWQPVFAQLADWRNAPDQVADEGAIVPPAALIECAEDVAQTLCTQRVEPPENLLTNGDGGVVFRWRPTGRTWSIEIDVDGSIESSLMAGSRLLWRHSIHERPAEAS